MSNSDSATLGGTETFSSASQLPTDLLTNPEASEGSAPSLPTGASVVTVTYQVGPTSTPASTSQGNGIPIGAIVGGALGGMAIVALIVFGWIWWGRSLKHQEMEKKRLAEENAMKKPRRPSMKHISSSTGSSFLTRDGKTVSFEIVHPNTAPSKPPMQTRRPPAGPNAAATGTTAAAGAVIGKIIVTPPEDAEHPRVRSPDKPEKSPFRPSRRHEAALAATHARTGSGGSYRPSPLSQGESYTAEKKEERGGRPPGAAPAVYGPPVPMPVERTRTTSSRSASASTTPTQTASGSRKTPSPSSPPPTPPFLRKSPSKGRTNASLAALHAAATTPTPNLSLLTQADGRVNRLSAVSVQPQPKEWEADQHPMPVSPGAHGRGYGQGQGQQGQGLQVPNAEEQMIWRGSRVESSSGEEA
ncbi:hypothetical protein DACRYDRAFT_104154 [Dacryopinax primogenitus]|uniref:Uncharacterized protein n=1 Tax=Dacryopinax primogenitus (strain DJM 731) TaxID=1858805 RepID=M5GBA4_DACPD|nr:uncharacterized protein DACRYDRAFT_104154 [Dacryopinax primogenitus]EJU05670.1 hypothetical protein DACRYDRAFT_104154 [Dacryopinax primogenitus]